MKRFAHAPLYGSAILGCLVACSSVGTTTDGTDTTTADVSSALQSAQCDFQSFKATADACFATFETCKAAVDANVEDCRTTLRTCLPPAPDGHRPHGKGGGNGERPPHDPNDTDDIGDEHGAPPDGGPPPEGEGRGRRGHRHGGRGHGGHPAPDAAAIEACHNALSTCLAAENADQTVCFNAEDSCVREAFKKPFKDACDTATPTCTDDAGSASADCVKVARCCHDGVDAPPDVDGGALCQ